MAEKKGTDLLAAKVAAEQQWIYEAHLAGYTKPRIRALALESPDAGGISRRLSMGEIREAINAVRTAQGSVIGTREERIEKTSHILDEQIELGLAARRMAAADNRIDYDAEKLIAAALDRKAKLHGDDAAQRVDVDVTTHDRVTEELDAMLARAGREVES